MSHDFWSKRDGFAYIFGLFFCCMPSAGLPFTFTLGVPGIGGGDAGPPLIAFKRLLGGVGAILGRSSGVSGAVPGRCFSVDFPFCSGEAMSELLEDAELELYIMNGFPRVDLGDWASCVRCGLELRALFLFAASSGPSLVLSRTL